MTVGVVRRAWDSDTCLAFLNDETGRADGCARVLEAAEKGEVELVVSTLAMGEVLFLRGQALPRKDRDKIRDFFKRDYIIAVDVTRQIAEIAQDVVWDYRVEPKDAIHVASALYAKAIELNTFDGTLLALDGKIGNPKLSIKTPDWETQHQLFE